MILVSSRLMYENWRREEGEEREYFRRFLKKHRENMVIARAARLNDRVWVSPCIEHGVKDIPGDRSKCIGADNDGRTLTKGRYLKSVWDALHTASRVGRINAFISWPAMALLLCEEPRRGRWRRSFISRFSIKNTPGQKYIWINHKARHTDSGQLYHFEDRIQSSLELRRCAMSYMYAHTPHTEYYIR